MYLSMPLSCKFITLIVHKEMIHTLTNLLIKEPLFYVKKKKNNRKNVN